LEARKENGQEMKRPQRAILGEHLVVCDRSGRTVLASETRKEWNGLRVYKDYWEPRHPQEFVRGRKDDQLVKDARPEIDLESQLGTATNAATTSAANLTLVSLDTGSSQRLNRAGVTVTDAGLPNYRAALRVQTSDDNATWTTRGSVDQSLEDAQSGTEAFVGLGVKARYVRVRLQGSQAQSVDHSTTLTVDGQDALSVSTGDL
jgi:hypothetical protein